YSTASPVRPAPRLIARSMLSPGTEFFFALCTASASAGLPAKSGPPILAATSMPLMYFAKAFARRESRIAFLCFVVAHLECPATGAPLFFRSMYRQSNSGSARELAQDQPATLPQS